MSVAPVWVCTIILCGSKKNIGRDAADERIHHQPNRFCDENNTKFSKNFYGNMTSTVYAKYEAYSAVEMRDLDLRGANIPLSFLLIMIRFHDGKAAPLL